MKFEEALYLEQKEGSPEAAIEYFRKAQYGYDKENKGALAVKLSQFSILTTKEMPLKDFWDRRKDSKLVEQFVKATLKLGKKYKVIEKEKEDFETYSFVVENMFGRKKPELDIVFDMEPGYNFKGLFKGEKFSIAKVKHDEEEAERGAWATKEKEELGKLK
jgi:hypothetical protein